MKTAVAKLAQAIAHTDPRAEVERLHKGELDLSKRYGAALARIAESEQVTGEAIAQAFLGGDGDGALRRASADIASARADLEGLRAAIGAIREKRRAAISRVFPCGMSISPREGGEAPRRCGPAGERGRAAAGEAPRDRGLRLGARAARRTLAPGTQQLGSRRRGTHYFRAHPAEHSTPQ